MSDHQEMNSFFQKPGCITRQSFVLKDITSSSTWGKKLELDRLLELLNITNDITLQLKVFSAISAYLMFNKGANIDVIIKCNAVYDKIHGVLSTGLPRKSTEALNFLSVLLYIDAEDGTKQRALAIYARNMTRVSGCLAAMCEMFTECMLYHDTWKALCQCLAVACNGCEMNQSYCSHLVPVCIQKCSQVNIDILLVLQSLLLNHDRNNQLFLDCNGVNIFTRELLHYDKCLQLLTTVVQNTQISSLIQQTNVLADLRDFLRLYGPNSQLGQKAIIILNHINSSAKGKEPHKNRVATETEISNRSLIEIDPAKKSTLQNDLNANTENDFEETNVLIQNVMKEIFNWKQNELQNLKITEPKPFLNAVNESKGPSISREQKFLHKNKEFSNKTNRLTQKRSNDVNKMLETTKRKAFQCNTASDHSFLFLQNNHFKVPKSNNTQKTTNTTQHILSQKRTNEVNQMMETTKRKAFECNTASELSFSFLHNDDFQVPRSKDAAKLLNKMHKKDTQTLNIDDTQSNGTILYRTTSDTKNCKQETTTLEDFSPIFASTPKQTTVDSNKTTESQAKQNKYNNLKKKRRNAKREPEKKKGMKNRSLGAKFFGVINESCTTFVKTVKNFFNKKESSDCSRSSSSNLAENTIVKGQQPNTYSFINYMKKRDAVLNNNWMKNNITDLSIRSAFSTQANSCKTCDNTEVLKHKLTKDEFLKKTVKKLKLGINLYGCDFKKISNTMWPRETYMTPLVLYNLYRKLLLK